MMTDEDAVHLSVVIPAFEEAKRIGPTLLQVRAYLDDQPFASEVVVVVDGGRDGTLELVRAATTDWPTCRVLNNPTNQGKGHAVRRGMLSARGRYLLFSDADLSTPIAEVKRLMAPLEAGRDIAIGSRALADSDVRVRQAWWRQAMGRVFNQIVRRVAVPDIRDTQCGFKCFRREAGRRVFARQRTTRFSFDVELLWIARKLGYQVVEVPVTWVNDPSSRVHPVRDSLSMLVDLARLRYHDLRGAYGAGDDRAT
ncbi:MAG: glycosyltransferase family 2 protein [Vicinamibacterales bacterium]|jgi:dolichyl-phosphate beta-glucosyltransferase|nr:glycosyltransferase family 2 protein [Vicinamibacterales bacterium]